MQEEAVGIVAGNVWKHLSDNGASDVIKIKFALNITNTELFLSLGWLLREGKLKLWEENSLIKAAIKEA